MSDQQPKSNNSAKRGLLDRLVSAFSADNRTRRNEELEEAVKIFPDFVGETEREADLKERLRVYSEISRRLSKELRIDYANCYACIIRLVKDDDKEILATIPQENLTIKKSLDVIRRVLVSVKVSYQQVSRRKVETNVEMIILRNRRPVRQSLSWETSWDFVSQDVREAILRNQSPIFILYRKEG